MARNEEKAQSLLNRWTSLKAEDAKGGRQSFLSSETATLSDCEKKRRELLREIGRKVSEIQNAALGEHRIRDLNDKINKLLREKYFWEKRIAELGGADYTKMGAKFYDADGKELVTTGGYKYFGAARNLPGVRELFEAQAPQKPRRTRQEMYRGINPDYYGYRDEDDGLLVTVEKEREGQLVQEEVEKYYEQKKRRLEIKEANKAAGTLEEALEDEDTSEEEEEEVLVPEGSTVLRSHVPLPNQSEIQELVLKRKKELLLAALDGA